MSAPPADKNVCPTSRQECLPHQQTRMSAPPADKNVCPTSRQECLPHQQTRMSAPQPPFAWNFSRISSSDVTDSYRLIIDALAASRRVLVTTHVRPDGDALGTVAA